MGYRQIPYALRAPGLHDAQKLTLAMFAEYCHENQGYATFVQQKTIAEALGRDKSNLAKDVKELKRLGYLRQEVRNTSSGRRRVFVVDIQNIKNATARALGVGGTGESGQSETRLSVVESTTTGGGEHHSAMVESTTTGGGEHHRQLFRAPLPVVESTTTYKGYLNGSLNSSLNPEALNETLNAGNDENGQPSAAAEAFQQLPGQTDLLDETNCSSLGALHTPDTSAPVDPEQERARQENLLRQLYPQQFDQQPTDAARKTA